ncbi:DUF411 domain-containing protein [Psychrobacter aquaticus]|uniref:CopG protein n=1 Tax=Psychrobacter aquaticus CMS 56 TaxID=1354303 RepID=U4T3H1_9GAMM|nr:DUF411 domain-containing protein [Psychrobacter aquaticus]ERL55782.1 CopG protein [Psychrobacter aquaticus CMS 56]
MTIFAVKSDFKPFSQSPKRVRVATAVLATVILSACGQADINASKASTPDANAVDSSAMPVEQAVTATQVSNSDLLKNVSATIYKDANCGCCKEWVDHAQAHGLSSTVQHPTDLSLFKDRYGVPTEMRSCHTTVTTDGYVFEGHVPAKYVAEFLQNPPEQAIGLAVPGMPVGSPGMEYQDQFMPYQIMQINKDGTNQVYAEVESSAQQL